MGVEYSSKLCDYIGKIELKAFHSRDSFSRYMVFCKALDSLSNEKLPKEDSKLAGELLRIRIRDTKPHNIGSASEENEGD
jgi:hypothetical protein